MAFTRDIDLGMNLSLHIVCYPESWLAEATLVRMPDVPLEADVMLNRWSCALDRSEYADITWPDERVLHERVFEDLVDVARDAAGLWLRKLAELIDERPFVTHISLRNDPCANPGIAASVTGITNLEQLVVGVRVEGENYDRVVFHQIVEPMNQTINTGHNLRHVKTKAFDGKALRLAPCANHNLRGCPTCGDYLEIGSDSLEIGKP